MITLWPCLGPEEINTKHLQRTRWSVNAILELYDSYFNTKKARKYSSGRGREKVIAMYMKILHIEEKLKASHQTCLWMN